MDPKMEKKLKKYQDKGLVFRSYKKSWIIVMRKMLNAVTNENREGIYDKQHATYKGKGFTIVDTICKDDQNIAKNNPGYYEGIMNMIKKLVLNINNKKCREANYYVSYLPAYYHDIQRVKDGEIKRWDIDGRLNMEYTCVNNRIDGVYNEWNNGNLKAKIHYKNGQFHGTNERWLEDGTLIRSGVYEHGKEQGLHRNYYYDGSPEDETNYLDGRRHGELTEWYDDHTMESYHQYHHGGRHGIHNEWFADGKTKINATYIRGRLDGIYKEWDKDGNIIKHRKYDRGYVSDDFHIKS
jgi:antitoxin component YwqK of YwqJK toxin-antitoxin module